MTQFGDRVEIIISPRLVIMINEMLEEWVLKLVEAEEVDLERESIGFAQQLLDAIVIASNSKTEVGNDQD